MPRSRSRSRSRHRGDDQESSSYRSYNRHRSRSRSRRRDSDEKGSSRSYHGSRHRSRSWSRHRDDDHVEDKKSSSRSYHRSRHHSFTSVATSSSTPINDKLKTVLRLKQNQIWPRINAAVYDYLRGVGWEGESSTMTEMDPSAIHSLLISSMVGVGGTVSSSIALQGWIEDNQDDINSEPGGVSGQKQDEDEHERLLKKIQDDIEIELELESEIILKMLDIMDPKRGPPPQKKSLTASTFILKTDQRVLLLDLGVWALEQWKTLSTGGSSLGKHKLVKSFERCFLQVAHQIRIESAISSQLKASTRSLELLQKMRSMQRRWVALGGSIRLRVASSSGSGPSSLLQRLERRVEEEIEDKMRHPKLKLESLIYFKPYEIALEQLEKECRRNSGDKCAQGKLIKKMLHLFKSSAALDKGHRDHVFFTTIIAGHVTRSGGLTFKRAIVWLVLGILPHLQEKGAKIRLLNSMQGVIRQAIVSVTGTDGKREVSTWRLILETYLKDEDMDFFHHRVQDRKILEEIGSFGVAKNFEYFYPSPVNTEEEKPVCFMELLSTATTPWTKPDTGANIAIENQEIPHTEPNDGDFEPMMPGVEPHVEDFVAKSPSIEKEVDTDSLSDISNSIDSDEMEFLKTVVSVSTLSLEEKEIDPWEIREINYDDPNVEWVYDNFEETITIE